MNKSVLATIVGVSALSALKAFNSGSMVRLGRRKIWKCRWIYETDIRTHEVNQDADKYEQYDYKYHSDSYGDFNVKSFLDKHGINLHNNFPPFDMKISFQFKDKFYENFDEAYYNYDVIPVEFLIEFLYISEPEIYLDNNNNILERIEAMILDYLSLIGRDAFKDIEVGEWGFRESTFVETIVNVDTGEPYHPPKRDSIKLRKS